MWHSSPPRHWSSAPPRERKSLVSRKAVRVLAAEAYRRELAASGDDVPAVAAGVRAMRETEPTWAPPTRSHHFKTLARPKL
jgi:hypothetical protein